MQQQNNINFLNFTPIIHIGFWSSLGKKKVEEWKLDESEKPLITKFKNSSFKDKKSQLTFDAYSFDNTQEISEQGPVEFLAKSKLLNFNTAESFKDIDIQKIVQQQLQNMKNDIDLLISGKETNLASFTETTLITFADLKKYIYNYKIINNTFLNENFVFSNQTSLKNVDNFNLTNFDKILREFFDSNKVSSPFFSYNSEQEKCQILTENILQNLENSNNNQYLVFYDPYNQPEGTNAILQNLISLLIFYQEEKKKKFSQKIKLILLKDTIIHKNPKPVDYKFSQILDLDLTNAEIKYQDDNKTVFDYTGKQEITQVKQINLKDQMDEQSIARDAIDLNVKLMKWRMLPDLNFDLIKSTKCLLIGAGTLGCQLSRNLIGWGIQNITFVDNGKVSYSNPVRQSLYEFEDTINGGQPKAPTAAKKLKKIFPEINAQGFELQIPMPGHFIIGEEQKQKALAQVDFLEELVSTHDAIFLMTDNRESRWLPSVLANKYNKICLTVGLGFDTYVIVRHGYNSEKYLSQPKETRGDRLACYFCNDIAVPGNSMKDRTLDQQCTVTRPGLSFVSAAYTSELFISILSHPLKNECPANEDKSKLQETDLGILPQHIRGNMSDFETSICFGSAFENCIACSNNVLQAYLKDRDEFLINVINDNSYLHKVAGIQEVQEIDESAIIVIDDDDFQ